MKVRLMSKNRTESGTVASRISSSLLDPLLLVRALRGRTWGFGRTEDELFDRREYVHAQGHLELVHLELQPLAEGLERRRHGEDLGRPGRRGTRIANVSLASVVGPVASLKPRLLQSRRTGQGSGLPITGLGTTSV